MSKSPSRMFIVSWALFPFDVLVCLGSTRDAIIQRIARMEYKLSDDELRRLEMYGTGRTIMLIGGQTVLWTKDYPRHGSGVMAHEIYHAVDFVLGRMGIRKQDELVAYMIEYLTNQITRRL